MKTLLTYQGIGIIVEVPNKAKMDYDDEDLAGFKFGYSQESKIEPPLVIDSIVDIGLVEKPFQHTCLKHLQDCVVNGD